MPNNPLKGRFAGFRFAWIAHVFGRDTLWAGYSLDGDEHPAQNAE
jgi:hypothetical protein